jgi:hypothetical protein
MVVALAKVVIAVVVSPLLNGLHSGASGEVVVGVIGLARETLGLAGGLSELPGLCGFWCP